MAAAVKEVDALLVGGGIMSATLGMLLQEIAPDHSVMMVEARSQVAEESSEAWNNAGTGHAGLCELNYTDFKNGRMDISKAVKVSEQFQMSLGFWTALVQTGRLQGVREFLNPVAHMSFVSGEPDVKFLRARYEAMREHPFFQGMTYSEDPAQIAQWAPLMMEGRDPAQPVAMTRAERGTDVDFGALTRKLTEALGTRSGFTLCTGTRVTQVKRNPDGRWRVRLQNLERGGRQEVLARFVFLGAGGGALSLLQQAGIPEGNGYGGFPVSGQWLRCQNRALIERHSAKVYGKASVGAPPMSVPHLDTRMIAGRKELLFGPFAGFSTKFLKGGSYLDLPLSVKAGNLLPMVRAGLDNIGLTRYLIGQVMQSQADRVSALREFLPEVRGEDWTLEIAGQRVQIIKKDAARGGKLEFGTEVIRSQDASLAALLGASPGASVAVAVMLDVLQGSFAGEIPEFADKVRKLIPSYGIKLETAPDVLSRIRGGAQEILGLQV